MLRDLAPTDSRSVLPGCRREKATCEAIRTQRLPPRFDEAAAFDSHVGRRRRKPSTMPARPAIVVDFRPYSTSVRTLAVHARPMARELRKSAPASLPKDIHTALAIVEGLAEHIQVVLDERDKSTPAAVRPQLDACQSTWLGVHGSLEAKARVPADVSDAGKQATEILASYFADGTSFTRLDARAFWSEAQRRLDRMERDGDATRITQLVGKDIVVGAKKTTAALGEAIGVGKTTRDPAPSTTALQEVLFRFSRAVGKYGRLMSARVDEDDPESIDEFLGAMAPIDQYRSSRTKDEELVEQPAEPVAPEPTAP